MNYHLAIVLISSSLPISIKLYEAKCMFIIKMSINWL